MRFLEKNKSIILADDGVVKWISSMAAGSYHPCVGKTLRELAELGLVILSSLDTIDSLSGKPDADKMMSAFEYLVLFPEWFEIKKPIQEDGGLFNYEINTTDEFKEIISQT